LEEFAGRGYDDCPTVAGDQFVLSLVDRQRFEATVTAFERAWKTGLSPQIAEYLLPEPDRQTVLLELIHIDLEYRLKSDLPARVEDYLAQFPELATGSSIRLSLIATEFRFRKRREPHLRRMDYVDRFPDEWQNLPADPPTITDGRTLDEVTPASLVGPPIPGLHLIRVLGEGGMGVVYLAFDATTRREVAVKTLRGGLHSTTDQRQRFRVEIEAVAKLNHDAIVHLLSAGEVDGVPYFMMDYLPGGTLASHTAGQPQAIETTIAWVQRVAEAVHVAHQFGILHRDLKPHNILLTNDRRPKISDFGLAHLGDSSDLSQTGDVRGTPSYMAPEQARGQRQQMGPPADIYSLGAILYELLTGRPPFRGESHTETLHQVLFSPLVPPGQLRPGLHRDLEAVCLKCLERNPAQRYVTAAALADDLARYLAGQPTLARPLSVSGKVWRLCLRHPLPASLFATLAIVIMASLISLSLLLNRAESRRIEADEARTETQREQEVTIEKIVELLEYVPKYATLLASTGSADVAENLIRKSFGDYELLKNRTAKSSRPESNIELEEQYCRLLYKLAEIQLEYHTPEQAAETFQMLIDKRRRLYAMHPSTERSRQLARALNMFSSLKHRLSEWTEMEILASESATILDQTRTGLVGESLSRLDEDLIAAMGNVTTSRISQHRWADAAKSNSRASELFVQHNDWSKPEHKIQLALTMATEMRIQGMLGNGDKSKRAIEVAMDLCDEALKENNRIIDFRAYQGDLYFARAAWESKYGSSVAQREWLEKAIATANAVLAIIPGHATAQKVKANAESVLKLIK
jgi:serine/threonine protein kinase